MKHKLPGIIALDYDGTLAQGNGLIAAPELNALQALGELGVVRVIATGRSLFSADTVMPKDLPLDYLVFSSGVGVMDWPKRDILASNNLDVDISKKISEWLKNHHLDFMIHHPAPDNHHFYYYESSHGNPDFYRRISRYKKFAWPLERCRKFEGISQLLVVVEQGGGYWLKKLRETFPGVNIVRTTSPLDQKSMWIEIFPRDVSKASGLMFIANQLNVSRQNIVCVGNDYNDLDMLRYGGKSFVVGNAPDELKREFQCIGHHAEQGVAELLSELGS
ncbi:MAG: HAD family hydrolase [Bacteroidota bacterium]|nr:HAD family hydrolase [Bacteroidota bacterium]